MQFPGSEEHPRKRNHCILSPKSKTAQAQARTRQDGSYVRSHKRTIKANKPSKLAKAPKPRRISLEAQPANYEKKFGFYAAAEVFGDCNEEDAKLIKSMMIQGQLDLVKGKH